MKRRISWMAAVLAPAIVAALAAGTAFAQQSQRTVAKLKDMQGNVLVSQGDAMAAGANDQRLAIGTRVVTTAGAKVTINYDVGCDITLKENERFTVRDAACAVLAKEVVALGPAEGAIGGGTAGATAGSAAGATAGASGLGGVGTVVGAVGFTAVGVGAYETFKKNTVSPN
jgi:hypothetical protein